MLIQAQKEKELSLLREHIDALKTRLSKDAPTAQTKISDLEATLVAANVRSEKVVQDHMDTQNKLYSVRIQAELDSKALEVRISHLLEEAATQ
jgi:hypothetical protein